MNASTILMSACLSVLTAHASGGDQSEPAADRSTADVTIEGLLDAARAAHAQSPRLRIRVFAWGPAAILESLGELAAHYDELPKAARRGDEILVQIVTEVWDGQDSAGQARESVLQNTVVPAIGVRFAGPEFLVGPGQRGEPGVAAVPRLSVGDDLAAWNRGATSTERIALGHWSYLLTVRFVLDRLWSSDDLVLADDAEPGSRLLASPEWGIAAGIDERTGEITEVWLRASNSSNQFSVTSYEGRHGDELWPARLPRRVSNVVVESGRQDWWRAAVPDQDSRSGSTEYAAAERIEQADAEAGTRWQIWLRSLSVQPEGQIIESAEYRPMPTLP